METLEIKKDAAIAAHKNAKKSGKKMLEDLLGKKVFQLEVTERIKTFDDVLDEVGCSHEEFYGSCLGLSNDEVAYRQVKLIVKALNEGWEPDWTNSNESKYSPWFKMGSASGAAFSSLDYDRWISLSRVGSRLCFKSSELARYAGQQFQSIYKDFLTL